MPESYEFALFVMRGVNGCFAAATLDDTKTSQSRIVPIFGTAETCQKHGCCDCRSGASLASNATMSEPDKKEIAARKEKADFENYLHNHVFISRKSVCVRCASGVSGRA